MILSKPNIHRDNTMAPTCENCGECLLASSPFLGFPSETHESSIRIALQTPQKKPRLRDTPSGQTNKARRTPLCSVNWQQRWISKGEDCILNSHGRLSSERRPSNSIYILPHCVFETYQGRQCFALSTHVAAFNAFRHSQLLKLLSIIRALFCAMLAPPSATDAHTHTKSEIVRTGESVSRQFLNITEVPKSGSNSFRISKSLNITCSQCNTLVNKFSFPPRGHL
jgi:hypothetical protein